MIQSILKVFLISMFALNAAAQQSRHDLQFNKLPVRWDEALPLGNGMLGALVWEKEGRLRFSLDRADLWDTRPMKGLHRNEFSYQWVYNQVMKKDYKPVQKYLDGPYDKEPAPTKIPGAAIEFNTGNWGKVLMSSLQIQPAVAIVKWANGASLQTFVDANHPAGWFRFNNVPADFSIQLNPPKYSGVVNISGDVVGGDDLTRLDYKQGSINAGVNSIVYLQEGWGGFKYQVSVLWEKKANNVIEGTWTISSGTKKEMLSDIPFLAQQLKKSFQYQRQQHVKWWSKFWSKSSLQVPDSLIEKQWYLEQYKFGATSRKGSAPISLQAIWTADNGRIPPWKGDFHHDLNTQLSYWSSYSANHLTEGMVYLDNLDANKKNYKRYTKLYFNKPGLAVPGVTTLDGTEMGGWIQYALSPTASAWLSHHYYLQWRYSMDVDFLKKRAYPWIREAAVFFENITQKDSTGFRHLPISSSPEINDNDLSAWFLKTTNYDLALMKNNFKVAAELANELGLKREASHWLNVLSEFPDYALSANNEMMFAPSFPYQESHRHFSHLMAIHPLGLIKWEDGEKEKSIIKNSLHLLDSIGPVNWCGYSYAWQANLKARAKDADGAVKALQIFIKAFCSPNSFHLNGDQTKSGYSGILYNAFTLEGNFAFAAGLQEMLLQSNAGFIEIMPAVPDAWKDVSFDHLRAEGAYLVSAKKVKGVIQSVTVFAEKGGVVKLKIPSENLIKTSKGNVKIIKRESDFITVKFNRGATLQLNGK